LKKPTPDDSINQRVTTLSKDPDLIKKLAESFAPSLYGLTNIKLAILYHLVGGETRERGGLTNRGPIHVLLIGDPGTGKTTLLQHAARLSETISLTGTGVNNNGLSGMITIDQNGDPKIIEGALAIADQKHLHIDKLDKMPLKIREILETAMEQQLYPISKNGVTISLNTRISVLASANPLLGRYNPYQTIAQNINLPVGLLSCFDLIFILRDQPDRLKDKQIAETILEIRELDTSEKESPIDDILFRAYIEQARLITPAMSSDAKSKLRDFYINIRMASEERDAITITPRQLYSLVRISEARAKLHLRETVTVSDVEAAVRIFSKSLEQVGIDPVSNDFDVDVLYTGRPSVLNSKLLKVVEVFSELEQISTRVSEDDLQCLLFERYGMSRRAVGRLLRTLVKENIVSCNVPGYYQRHDNGLGD